MAFTSPLRKALLLCGVLVSLAAAAPDKLIQISSCVPADSSLVLLVSDLKALWQDFKATDLWTAWSRTGEGRAFAGKFQAALKGLEAVGLTSTALADMFGDASALFLRNADLGRPEFAFVIRASDSRDFFDDLTAGLSVFAAVQQVPVVKEQFLSFTAVSLSSNLHYCDTGDFFVAGNRLKAVESALSAIRARVPSLASNAMFRTLAAEGLEKPRLLAYCADQSLFPTFAATGATDFLLSGRVGRSVSSVELRITLAGPSNAPGLARLKALSLDPPSVSFAPRYFFSCESLDRNGPPYAADVFIRPFSPVRETRRDRNVAFAAAAFALEKAVSSSNALLLCKPYGSSTNYAFVFRSPWTAKDDSGLARILWPGKKILQTGHNGRVIWYFAEPENGPDEFNYLYRRGDRLLVADSLKMCVACMDASEGVFDLKSSETFAAAWRTLKDPRRVFYVFSTMKWANTVLGDGQPNVSEGLKEFSSLVLFSINPPRTLGFSGLDVDIYNQPVVAPQKP